jgi:hypothetical protein
MRRAAPLLAIALLIALSGCVNYALVEPGRTTVRGELSVEPTIAWNKRRQLMLLEDEIFADNPAVEIWTQNGTGIDQLAFYVGVEPGQPLVRGRAGRDMPRFRAGMSGVEVVELFESALAAGLRATEIERRELRPLRFAGGDGFAFRIGFTLDDEVERELSAAGTVRGNKLYLIAWAGTRLYHHELYLAEFERIVASARIG